MRHNKNHTLLSTGLATQNLQQHTNLMYFLSLNIFIFFSSTLGLCISEQTEGQGCGGGKRENTGERRFSKIIKQESSGRARLETEVLQEGPTRWA